MKTIFTFMALLFMAQFINAEDLKQFRREEFTTGPGKEINVKIATGDVILTGVDGDKVTVTIYTKNNIEEKLDFSISSSGNGVDISIKKKSFVNRLNGYLKVEVTLPKKYLATVATSGGDIYCKYLEGDHKLATSGGDIKSFDCIGNNKLSTAGGDIFVKKFRGQLAAATSGGDIEVLETIAPVDASTSGGDIKLEVASSSIKATTSGGDILIAYSGENKSVYATTSGGDVHIKIPSTMKADVTLDSSGGDVKCSLDMSSVEVKKSNRIVGEVNGGGEKIKATTSGGDAIISALN